MSVSASAVKELRELTGVGMLECKRALDEVNGDLEKAKNILREKGVEVASKKSSRMTGEGIIVSYIHHNSRLGALVELDCETDFVARTDDFQRLAHDIARQVAAYDPAYLTEDELPSEESELAKEKVLLLQPFINDESITVSDLIQREVARTGENIRIRRFSRFQIGS